MEFIFWAIITLPYFVWPIFHAIWGTTRKTKALKIIFFGLLGISLLALVLTFFDLQSGDYERGELFAGLSMFVSFIAVACLVASLIVILFVREAKESTQ